MATPNEEQDAVGTSLVLADGTKIDTATGEVIRDRPNYFNEPASTAQGLQYTPRGLDEVGITSDVLRASALVAALTIIGLSDRDIGNVLAVAKERVQAVRELGAYDKVIDFIVQSVAEAYANDARMIFASQSRNAAQRMIDLADSEDEKVAQKATADVLDRAGLRPVDVVQHKLSLDGTLRIEHIKNDKAAVIDVEVDNNGDRS